ncbi:hypothetical protein [Streptomyces noursei]|uniref:hypothetical protein n=1 Tax=Streptomyces noursei TaxID=1971 RepID=UPI0016739C11|nr:hypothetical protein [Streptomyces noursei]MCZ1014466.1 hypothetical protein [Streptomyces noursei]GGW95257.1 hypothetical protein GCM10010341_15550 [Streptomyces noursei]
MTTKNLAKTTEPGAPAAEIKTAHVTSIGVRTPMETITLSHHLNIEGTAYLPGSKVRVPSDYARRLRRQGYVART